MAKGTTKTDYYCKKDLKDRGWTDMWIVRFLGDPDTTRPNPKYRTAAPMLLYSKHRVHQVEVSDEFQATSRSAEKKRNLASEKALERASQQRKKLHDYIEKVLITVPKFPLDALVGSACDHYNALWSGRGKDEKRASPNDNAEFLARITVNMLRHEFTNYEYEIGKMFGKIGKDEGLLLLKERVLKKIAYCYPHLADECERQMPDWVHIY